MWVRGCVDVIHAAVLSSKGGREGHQWCAHTSSWPPPYCRTRTLDWLANVRIGQLRRYTSCIVATYHEGPANVMRVATHLCNEGALSSQEVLDGESLRFWRVGSCSCHVMQHIRRPLRLHCSSPGRKPETPTSQWIGSPAKGPHTTPQAEARAHAQNTSVRCSQEHRTGNLLHEGCLPFVADSRS